MSLRRFTVAERRDRLARRQHLAPGCGAPDVETVAARFAGLHGTDPATAFLAAWARVPGFVPADLEQALYEDRTLQRHLCMRRTMFVVPTAFMPHVQAACTDGVAATMRRALARDLEEAGVSEHGDQWLDRAIAAAVAALADGRARTGAELAKEVPALATRFVVARQNPQGVETSATTRVLGLAAAEGLIVRGRPIGSWISSQYRWQLAATLDEPVPPPDVRFATRNLIWRWLRRFGPATVADVVWWTGLNAGPVRKALAELGVAEVEVEVADGSWAPGVVLADDVDPEPPAEHWVALLPALDPSPMGWKERGWFLGDHAGTVFDRSGNIGQTVWCDGRIVGAWAQTRDRGASGEVVHRLFDDVGREAEEAIAARAAELQGWLAGPAGGIVVTPRFPSPMDRELRGGAG